MSLFSYAGQLRSLSCSALLALGGHLAAAQHAPAKAYDFLTVTTMEASAKSIAKLLITPAFQGKTEVQLEDFGGFSAEKNLAKIQHNTELVNQQLADLTAAGWELVQAYPFASSPTLFTTRYLFRKAKI